MDESKKPAKRKKSKRKSKSEDESYSIEVQSWGLSYSFGLNYWPKLLSGQFIENLNLKIKGLMLRPIKFANKEIEVSLVGDRSVIPRISEEYNADTRPNGIGSLTIRGAQREYFGAIPFDTIPVIERMLESKTIRVIDLHGSAPVQGHANIRNMYFLQNHESGEE